MQDDDYNHSYSPTTNPSLCRDRPDGGRRRRPPSATRTHQPTKYLGHRTNYLRDERPQPPSARGDLMTTHQPPCRTTHQRLLTTCPVDYDYFVTNHPPTPPTSSTSTTRPTRTTTTAPTYVGLHQLHQPPTTTTMVGLVEPPITCTHTLPTTTYETHPSPNLSFESPTTPITLYTLPTNGLWLDLRLSVATGCCHQRHRLLQSAQLRR